MQHLEISIRPALQSRPSAGVQPIRQTAGVGVFRYALQAAGIDVTVQKQHTFAIIGQAFGEIRGDGGLAVLRVG